MARKSRGKSVMDRFLTPELDDGLSGPRTRSLTVRTDVERRVSLSPSGFLGSEGQAPGQVPLSPTLTVQGEASLSNLSRRFTSMSGTGGSVATTTLNGAATPRARSVTRNILRVRPVGGTSVTSSSSLLRISPKESVVTINTESHVEYGNKYTFDKVYGDRVADSEVYWSSIHDSVTETSWGKSSCIVFSTSGFQKAQTGARGSCSLFSSSPLCKEVVKLSLVSLFQQVKIERELATAPDISVRMSLLSISANDREVDDLLVKSEKTMTRNNIKCAYVIVTSANDVMNNIAKCAPRSLTHDSDVVLFLDIEATQRESAILGTTRRKLWTSTLCLVELNGIRGKNGASLVSAVPTQSSKALAASLCSRKNGGKPLVGKSNLTWLLQGQFGDDSAVTCVADVLASPRNINAAITCLMFTLCACGQENQTYSLGMVDDLPNVISVRGRNGDENGDEGGSKEDGLGQSNKRLRQERAAIWGLVRNLREMKESATSALSEQTRSPRPRDDKGEDEVVGWMKDELGRRSSRARASVKSAAHALEGHGGDTDESDSEDMDTSHLPQTASKKKANTILKFRKALRGVLSTQASSSEDENEVEHSGSVSLTPEPASPSPLPRSPSSSKKSTGVEKSVRIAAAKKLRLDVGQNATESPRTPRQSTGRNKSPDVPLSTKEEKVLGRLYSEIKKLQKSNSLSGEKLEELLSPIMNADAPLDGSSDDGDTIEDIEDPDTSAWNLKRLSIGSTGSLKTPIIMLSRTLDFEPHSSSEGSMRLSRLSQKLSESGEDSGEERGNSSLVREDISGDVAEEGEYDEDILHREHFNADRSEDEEEVGENGDADEPDRTELAGGWLERAASECSEGEHGYGDNAEPMGSEERASSPKARASKTSGKPPLQVRTGAAEDTVPFGMDNARLFAQGSRGITPRKEEPRRSRSAPYGPEGWTASASNSGASTPRIVVTPLGENKPSMKRVLSLEDIASHDGDDSFFDEILDQEIQQGLVEVESKEPAQLRAMHNIENGEQSSYESPRVEKTIKPFMAEDDDEEANETRKTRSQTQVTIAEVEDLATQIVRHERSGTILADRENSKSPGAGENGDASGNMCNEEEVDSSDDDDDARTPQTTVPEFLHLQDKKLHRVFKKYCRFGTDRLSAANYMKFVENSGVMSKRVTHVDVDTLYARVTRSGRDDGSPGRMDEDLLMTFKQFCASILGLSLLRYPRKKEIVGLFRLFKKHIIPHAECITVHEANVARPEKLLDSAVALVSGYKHHLREIFNRYCFTVESEVGVERDYDDDETEKSFDLHQYLLFAHDFGLLNVIGHGDSARVFKEAVNEFAKQQQSDAAPQVEIRTMNFPSFVKCLARVALHCFEFSRRTHGVVRSLTVAERVRSLFVHMTESEGWKRMVEGWIEAPPPAELPEDMGDSVREAAKAAWEPPDSDVKRAENWNQFSNRVAVSARAEQRWDRLGSAVRKMHNIGEESPAVDAQKRNDSTSRASPPGLIPHQVSKDILGSSNGSLMHTLALSGDMGDSLEPLAGEMHIEDTNTQLEQPLPPAEAIRAVADQIRALEQHKKELEMRALETAREKLARQQAEMHNLQKEILLAQKKESGSHRRSSTTPTEQLRDLVDHRRSSTTPTDQLRESVPQWRGSTPPLGKDFSEMEDYYLRNSSPNRGTVVSAPQSRRHSRPEDLHSSLPPALLSSSRSGTPPAPPSEGGDDVMTAAIVAMAAEIESMKADLASKDEKLRQKEMNIKEKNEEEKRRRMMMGKPAVPRGRSRGRGNDTEDRSFSPLTPRVARLNSPSSRNKNRSIFRDDKGPENPVKGRNAWK